jgi:hypothetical protein
MAMDPDGAARCSRTWRKDSRVASTAGKVAFQSAAVAVDDLPCVRSQVAADARDVVAWNDEPFIDHFAIPVVGENSTRFQIGQRIRANFLCIAVGDLSGNRFPQETAHFGIKDGVCTVEIRCCASPKAPCGTGFGLGVVAEKLGKPKASWLTASAAGLFSR